MKLYPGFEYCRLKIYINEIINFYGFSTVAWVCKQSVCLIKRKEHLSGFKIWILFSCVKIKISLLAYCYSNTLLHCKYISWSLLAHLLVTKWMLIANLHRGWKHYFVTESDCVRWVQTQSWMDHSGGLMTLPSHSLTSIHIAQRILSTWKKPLGPLRGEYLIASILCYQQVIIQLLTWTLCEQFM